MSGQKEMVAALLDRFQHLAFRYDAQDGRCVDARGRVGHNRPPVSFVRETTVGQCADLTGVELNENYLGDPVLPDWGQQDFHPLLLAGLCRRTF